MILWLINGNMKNSLEDESAGVAGVVLGLSRGPTGSRYET